MSNQVYVYTDGAYRDGIYAGAFLVYKGTQCIHSNSGCGTKASSMNNVAGELSAVMHAVVWLKKHNYTGTLVYDYTGIEKWLIKEWKAKNEFTQAYVKFMQSYLDIISFKWVKGHNGDLGNAQADKLASKALNSRKEWKR